MDTYILEGKSFRPSEDMKEWGEFMSTEGKEDCYRHVRRDHFYVGIVEYCNLSTVFLGIDHNYHMSDHNPVIFESMIFGGDLDESMVRYCFWDEAVVGHRSLCSSIDKTIRHKFDITLVTRKTVNEKSSIFYYKARVPAYIEFTLGDIRLIREN